MSVFSDPHKHSKTTKSFRFLPSRYFLKSDASAERPQSFRPVRVLQLISDTVTVRLFGDERE